MENNSGIMPLDLRVLVKPDPPESVTAGGIIIPDSTKEMQKSAAVKATLVAIGGNAFREAEAAGWCKGPEPGERIMIAKYGGVVVKGRDGEEYRLLNDEDVVARLEEGM
jgi:chaperonin GroES